MHSDYVPYPAVVCVTAPSAISAVARLGISRAECEIHEIPGQAISKPLYRGPRLLGALERFDNLPVTGISANPLGGDFERIGRKQVGRAHVRTPVNNAHLV